MEKLDSCNLCNSRDIKIIDTYTSLYLCNNCGYIFDNPRPTLYELIEYYSKPSQYDTWISDEKAREDLWKRRLNKIMSTKKEGSLLDVSTGIGQFLHLAKKNFSEVCGTEISESAIKLAKQKYNLDLYKGSLEDIDFKNKKFDNITFFHVLEHVLNPRELVKKSYELLSDDGILVIAVPNDVNSLKMLVKKALRKLGVKKFGIGPMQLSKIVLDGSVHEIHLSHFKPDVLERLLTAHGFEVIESSIDPYYVAYGLQKALKDVYYFIHFLTNKVFKVNLYDTIWITARKR